MLKTINAFCSILNLDMALVSGMNAKLVGLIVLEEVSSIVLDVGSKYLRMGFSGDDRPFVVIPSAVGVTSNGKHYFGDLGLLHPHDDMEIKGTIGLNDVLEWDLLEALLKHAGERIGVKWSDHPILYADNPLWSLETRTRFANMLFEKFDIPAIYPVHSTVLAAFSTGKHSAIVIDMGASGVRAGVVLDGISLVKHMVSEEFIGGNSISSQAGQLLIDAKIPVHIPQQVARKFAVGKGKPASFDPNMIKSTDSFINYHKLITLDDFKESVIQITELSEFNSSDLSKRTGRMYEFPDGYNSNYLLDRYKLGEILFHPMKYRFDKLEGRVLGLVDLVKTLVELYARDLPAAAMQTNIVISGGGSSTPGLMERLALELRNYRLHVGPTIAERRFAVWIGGSILASIGTAQQLWITRQAWKEPQGITEHLKKLSAN